jgi:DNA-binding NarL/FixJ family response regulator
MTRRGFFLSVAAGLLAVSGTQMRRTYWPHPLNRLSPREREVLALRANGGSKAQIGRELHLSLHTVNVHVQNIAVKLQVRSELEAIALVFH